MQESILALRRYRRGLFDLSVLALFSAVSLVLTLTDSSFYLIFSPFLPTAAYLLGKIAAELFGLRLLLTAGIFFSLCLVAVFVGLRLFAGKRLSLMTVGAILYAADTAVLLAFSLWQGFGIGKIDAALHLLPLLSLISAARAGARLRKMPEPTAEQLGEMLLAAMPPPEGLPLATELGDLPPDEEDTRPLRRSDAHGKRFFDRAIFDLQILVTRKRGLTELSVNGWVYAEVRGIREFTYSLTATVSGHRITVRLLPGTLYARMLLLVDGRLAGEIRRYV